IPNPEVKLTCGEGSARGTECENSKMHPLYFKKALIYSGLFCFKMAMHLLFVERLQDKVTKCHFGSGSQDAPIFFCLFKLSND
ncbi:MAG: hypothetical protein CME62_07950, partial [Halobacteriovoraceae bacterium]|nr:hypothetical protein [Halobacteriovoraceae bacterium]